MKQLAEAKDTIDIDGVVSIANGGTSASEAIRAAENLGMVLWSSIGRPLGPIPIDAVTRKIPVSYFSGLGAYRAEVDGDKEIPRGTTRTYSITNFDSRYTYKVTCIFGKVEINKDKIFYTAPIDRTQAPGFYLNNEFWTLVIRENRPLNPLFVQNVLRDKKSFVLRPEASRSLNISATGDFTNILISDPSATVDGSAQVGQSEIYKRTGTTLSKLSGRSLQSPGFTVSAFLGKVTGKFTGSSDADGWVDGSSNLNVGANSTFFEVDVTGGSIRKLNLKKGVVNSDYVDGYKFIVQGVTKTYLQHLNTRAENVSVYAGVYVEPMDVDLGEGQKLYIPFQARLLPGLTEVEGFIFNDSITHLHSGKKVTIRLATTEGSDDVIYSHGVFVGTIKGSWRIAFVEDTPIDMKALDSFFMIGNKVVRAKGQVLAINPPETVSLTVRTRENLNFAKKAVVASANVGITYTVSKAGLNCFGLNEYLEINNMGTQTLVHNPSGKSVVSGFGSFVSVSDDGALAVIGEDSLDFGRVHVYSKLGALVSTIVSSDSNSRFGIDGDISTDGTLVAICAPLENHGVVYVYDLATPTTFKIRIVNPIDEGFEFGRKAKFNSSKTRLFISAINPITFQGKVFVYDLTTTTATLLITLQPYNVVKNFGFDISPSGTGQHILIGAPGDINTDGQAQLWFEGDTEWEMAHMLIPSEATTGIRYGESVLLSKDAKQAIVSAPALVTSSTSFGRVYLFS